MTAFDPFQIEPSGELSEAERQKVIDYQTLIGLVFNTDEGKRLLDRWTQQHVFTPTVVPGNPIEAHGIAEGKASFVRHIHKVLDLINNNYYQKEDNSND